MAAFGRQEATQCGEFMGIEPTGKRVELRYMDFWKVKDGKIVDNWAMVDFPHVLPQSASIRSAATAGKSTNSGRKRPPRPAKLRKSTRLRSGDLTAAPVHLDPRSSPARRSKLSTTA